MQRNRSFESVVGRELVVELFFCDLHDVASVTSWRHGNASAWRKQHPGRSKMENANLQLSIFFFADLMFFEFMSCEHFFLYKFLLTRCFLN